MGRPARRSREGEGRGREGERQSVSETSEAADPPTLRPRGRGAGRYSGGETPGAGDLRVGAATTHDPPAGGGAGRAPWVAAGGSEPEAGTGAEAEAEAEPEGGRGARVGPNAGGWRGQGGPRRPETVRGPASTKAPGLPSPEGAPRV